MQVDLFSFGFKHGYPDADLVWDVRFLPNPYWLPELKDHTGLEEKVANYVLENDSGKKFIELIEPFLSFLINQYYKTDKVKIRIAIGCTGGKHRSVAVTEHLYQFLSNFDQIELKMFHRDLNKT